MLFSIFFSVEISLQFCAKKKHKELKEIEKEKMGSGKLLNWIFRAGFYSFAYYILSEEERERIIIHKKFHSARIGS